MFNHLLCPAIPGVSHQFESPVIRPATIDQEAAGPIV
jgi:hypothetical protein